MPKEFKKVEIKNLFKLDEENGEMCFASDRITVDGFKVGYMYRENPEEGIEDSGWRFIAGDEDDEYINNPDNIHVFALNTICNYDSDIIPYLHSPIGSNYIRIDNSKFEMDDGEKNIFICKQDV